VSRFDDVPAAISATVRAEHGATIIPIVLNDPEAIVAPISWIL